MDKFNFYWSTLLKNIEWIKFSETKAVVIITVYGVILTIVYSNAKEILSFIENSNLILALTVLSALFSIGSVLCSFLALNPILKNADPDSIIYFGHIQEKFSSSEDYSKYANEVIADSERLNQNIADQVYQTSKIAWRKFQLISWGIRFFAISLLLLIIEVATYLISV